MGSLVVEHEWRLNRKPDGADMPVGVSTRYEAVSGCGSFVYYLYRTEAHARTFTLQTAAGSQNDPRWVRVHGRTTGYGTIDTRVILVGPLGLAKETANEVITWLPEQITRLEAEAVDVPTDYPEDGTVTRGVSWTHEVPGGRVGERAPMPMQTIMDIEGSNATDMRVSTYRLQLDRDDRDDLYVDITRCGVRIGFRVGWAYGPSFGIRFRDLVPPGWRTSEIAYITVPAIQQWFSAALLKARYLLDQAAGPAVIVEPSDGDRDCSLSAYTQALVDRKPTAETLNGMAGPGPDADPDAVPPVALETDCEPILNNGSAILLYADATRLQVTLTRDGSGTATIRDHTGQVAPPVGRPYIRMQVRGWRVDDPADRPGYEGTYHYDDITRATRDAADLLRGVATTDTGQWIVSSDRSRATGSTRTGR